MLLRELEFPFPEELIATRPVDSSRVMWVEKGGSEPVELTVEELLARIPTGDALVINDTKVLKRRVFSLEEIEILFLNRLTERKWEVLMPARKIGRQAVSLPEGVSLRIVESGRPQIVELSDELSEAYFQKNGELPLPPYIQKSRGERKPVAEDERWYQTAWAQAPGSLAAPTASLHFTRDHLRGLRDRGVEVEVITLHVGLGTFLPIAGDDLAQHKMHSENVFVSAEGMKNLRSVKEAGGKIWALGTTVARALESCHQGMLKQDHHGNWSGETDLFVRPGFRFGLADRLMTNFHQPKTTLLALVMAFAGPEQVRRTYQWAIERRFRLFSYGDLTVWT